MLTTTIERSAIEALELLYDQLTLDDPRELDLEDDAIEPELPELSDQIAALALGDF